MAYTDETLKQVKQVWTDFKKLTKTNQTKAAEMMGMTQSAFGQYLRGDIPLNTDFISKFSLLTGKKVIDFLSPNEMSKVSLQSIAVKFTLSGKKLTDSYELIPSPTNLDHAYAILVDYPDFILERGTLLLIDTLAEVREHDTAMLHSGSSRPIYGVISYSEGDWEVLEPHYFGGKRYSITDSAEVNRVSGSYSPAKKGRLFKKPNK